jgi:hypothetical protein
MSSWVDIYVSAHDMFLEKPAWCTQKNEKLGNLRFKEHLSSPPVFSGVRVTRSLVLRVCFVDRCLSFCNFSFGHCVVCPTFRFTDSDYLFGIFKLFFNNWSQTHMWLVWRSLPFWLIFSDINQNIILHYITTISYLCYILYLEKWICPWKSHFNVILFLCYIFALF